MHWRALDLLGLEAEEIHLSVAENLGLLETRQVVHEQLERFPWQYWVLLRFSYRASLPQRPPRFASLATVGWSLVL